MPLGDPIVRLALALVLSVTASVAVTRYITPSALPGVVVLDVVKLNNSFRRTAEPLLRGGRDEDAADLTIGGRRALEVISAVAEGRTVIVKQAIVGTSGLPDITSEVIAALGLEEGAPVLISPPPPSFAPRTEKDLTWAERVLP